MRWLSPPERVPAWRLRLRYSRPTLCKKPSRARISFRMRSAIMACLPSRTRPSRNFSSSFTDRSVKSVMPMPPTVTALAVSFSRFPPQSGQGYSDIYCSSSVRMEGLCVS